MWRELHFSAVSLACLWPPRRESNPYLTLRRRVHYPLCYGEVGAYSSAGGLSRPASRRVPADCGMPAFHRMRGNE